MRHPESGFREVRTAQYVCGELDRMGLSYRSGLALTGVKARMSGRAPGPTVGILGELDSLIVSDHPYADPVTGRRARLRPLRPDRLDARRRHGTPAG
jgi:metal-dependent amidase/aminoacylase/carboxypeptidase family protein